jgi:MFS family permease
MSSPRAKVGPFGVFSQIGHAPALYALMAIMLPVTAAVMLTSTARNAFAAEGFDGAAGVGHVAVAATVGGTLAGLLAGSLADRYSPRRLMIGIYLAMALVTGALWLLVLQPDVTQPPFLALIAIDGALIAVCMTSLAKFQARLVPREAKGAAESVSGIRSGIGSLLGILLGLRVGSGASAILVSAVLFLVVAVLFMVFTKETAARAGGSTARYASARDFLIALRRRRELRDIVIADSLMFLVLPSALISLGVVAEDVIDLNPMLLSAGIVGVLLGRILVAARGTLGAVPRDLTIATVLYSGLAFISWYLLEAELLLNQVVLLAVIATIASSCGSFIQALMSAKLQERLPEEMRARGTGVIYGLRGLQMTIGVTLATWVVTGWSLHEYLFIVGMGLLLVMIGLKGFRRIV